MAPKLPPLSTLKLKLTRLKRVAVATGINSSGTKADLTTRLELELQNDHNTSDKTRGLQAQRKARRQTQRIVSIDMGIRNLAYCVLAVPAAKAPKRTSKTGRARPPSPPVVVEAWTRIAVSAKTPPALAPPEPTTDANDDPSVDADATATATAKRKSTSQKEAFDPATYARHAYALIASLLRTHAPSTILIERQRYRSMGAAAVQEWTLRVNMFEAMLHAVLETLGREGKWVGEVWAVSPGKVLGFWVAGAGAGADPGEEVGGGKGKGKKRGNKGVKIDVVGGWLVDGGGKVRLEGQAVGMGSAFLGRWRGVGGRKRVGARRKGAVGVEETGAESEGVGDGQGGVEAGIGKLDDLADCLLQGVAWVKWQENRRLLVDGGVEALDGLD